MDVLQILASLSSAPQVGSTSGSPFITTPVDETQQIESRLVTAMDLSVEGPIAIPFAQLTGANVVYLKIVVGQGSTVVATITSSKGTAQTVPFDDLFLLVSSEDPLTAISLTRSPGAECTV